MKRRLFQSIGLAALTLSVSWVGGASALSGPGLSDGDPTLFPIPTPNSASLYITTGEDGNFWFTEQNTNKVVKFNLAGDFTEYTLPRPFSAPSMITACADRGIWFTEYTTNQIGRITEDGTITEFPVPTSMSGPFGIACQLDRSDNHIDIVFTESNANQIGWMQYFPDHYEITEFSIPTPSSRPGGITFGPGGVWFTEFDASRIGMLTSDGNFSEHITPTPSHPFYIEASDSRLWFTQFNENSIGRFEPVQGFTEFHLPTPNSNPFAITNLGDQVVFSKQALGHLGAITLEDVLTEIFLRPNSGPSGIAPLFTTTGTPLGHLAVLLADTNQVAVLEIPPVPVEFTKTASPDPVQLGEALTYTFTVTNHLLFPLICFISDLVENDGVVPSGQGWDLGFGSTYYSRTLTANPGETNRLQLTVFPSVKGPLENSATLNCGYVKPHTSVISVVQ